MEKWSRGEVTKLIVLVKKHPELWLKTHEKYQNRSVKDKIWGLISNILGRSECEIKRKFKNLRTQYNAELTKEYNSRETNPDAAYKSGWPFMEEMQYFSKMNSSGEKCFEELVENTLDDEEEIEEMVLKHEIPFKRDELSTENFNDLSQNGEFERAECVIEKPTAKRLKIGPSISLTPLYQQQSITSDVNPLDTQKDDSQIFGDYVAAELREVRSISKRKQLKYRIQKAILDIGYEEQL